MSFWRELWVVGKALVSVVVAIVMCTLAVHALTDCVVNFGRPEATEEAAGSDRAAGAGAAQGGHDVR